MALTKVTQDNIGAVCRIRITPVTSTTVIPRNIEGLITPEIETDATGVVWEDIPFTVDTANYAENEVQVKGTSMYQSVVQLEIARDSKLRQAETLRLKRGKWLVEVMDHNRLIRVMGTVDEPALFSVLTRTTQEDTALRNTLYCQFSCTTRKPDPFYEEELAG